MDTQKSLFYITSWLLRLGVIVFLIPVFLEFWENPGSVDEFWMWFLKVLYLLVFIVVVVLSLTLRLIRYYTFGFSLVMIVSVYKIVDIYFKYGITTDQAIYVLLIAVSLYFMTKSERKRKKRF